MPAPIELRSDNAAGAAPELLAAAASANAGSALAYGGDDVSRRLDELVREVFEHPHAKAFPVVSGTAANAIALSALTPPWGMIVCHETAHINVDEAGAASQFSGGAVIRGIAGDQHKVHAAALQSLLDRTYWGDPHRSQPSVVSLTCPTDRGTIYTPTEVAAISEVAARRSLRVHLDGARLANAIVSLGSTPHELTCGAGVQMLSLGAIKNGGISADAIVSFDPDRNEELTFRLKRSGHVASKMRFQAAQLVAYLTGGLWLQLAARANQAMDRLAVGLGAIDDVLVLDQPAVNMVFVQLGDTVMRRLADDGVLFYEMGGGVARFVTSWQTTDGDVDEVLRRVRAAVGA